MRALMIPSARLKIDEANDEARSALNKSQRSLGLARATKTPERSHRAETYKLLLHQRCLRGHPAKVSQKSATRYFSVCIFTQWTIIFCYSQTATQRLSAPFFFAFLFLLLRACQPWGGLIIRDLNFPQSPAPLVVLAVQTHHHPRNRIISPKPDLCNKQRVWSQIFLYVRPQRHNRWYCMFVLLLIMKDSSTNKNPWGQFELLSPHLAQSHHGYDDFCIFPPWVTQSQSALKSTW